MARLLLIVVFVVLRLLPIALALSLGALACTPGFEGDPDFGDKGDERCDGAHIEDAVCLSDLGDTRLADQCCFADSCSRDSDCPTKEWCSFGNDETASEGLCKPIPSLCPATFFPVCGRDGQSYSNECLAYQASTDALASELCP